MKVKNLREALGKGPAKDDPKGKVRVFVYGTLKRCQGNNIVLRGCNAEMIGMDTITGDYLMIDLNGCFPAVVESPLDVEAKMYGEVWAGDEEMLHALDALEGHPNFYERKKVRADELDKNVWVYMLHEDWAEEAEDVVELGCWKPNAHELRRWGVDTVGNYGLVEGEDAKEAG